MIARSRSPTGVSEITERRLAGEPGAVGPGEDVLAGDAVRRAAHCDEEVAEHACVALDGAPAAAAALLLGEEGVQRALPGLGVSEGRDRLFDGAPPRSRTMFAYRRTKSTGLVAAVSDLIKRDERVPYRHEPVRRT